MATKFEIQINDVARGVRCYDLIDTETDTIVGEYMERTEKVSSLNYPLSPSGHRNAIVAAYAWQLLKALEDATAILPEHALPQALRDVHADLLAALKELGPQHDNEHGNEERTIAP